MRHDKRADCIVRHPAAGIAEHVRIALGEAKELRWVEPRIHTSQYEKVPAGWQWQMGLVAEMRCITCIGSDDLIGSTKIDIEN